VEQARPHVERANEKVFQPAKQYYDIYGAPRVAQVQSVSEAAWTNTVKPRIELRRQWVKAKYEENLSPHVNQVVTATNPYVDRAKSEVLDIYESTLIPAFEKSLPYLQSAYAQGHYYATEIVLPYAQTAEQSTTSFLSRKVWPRLIILYGENVEPQLMKISERLGRYKDSKKLEASVERMEASSKVTKSASSLSSAASVVSPTSRPTTTATEAEKEADSREKIESDLKTWQEKFAKAADKGAEDLQERVKEITKRQVDSQAHVVGKAFVVRLEETASSAIDTLKAEINDVVKGLPEDANEKAEDAAYDQIISSVRTAGSAIKEKAQAVRTWKQRYDNDTMSLVQAALQSTWNVIDSIRDLGLQEIGMRWAWMEGVTYQDWSKYHDLKSTFDEWRNGVEKVALGHKGLKTAQDEGEAVQESAMEAAEKAAKELARLKEVARWKIDSRDSTENFIVAGKVKRTAQKVASAVESVADSVTEAAVDAPSSVSEAVADAPSSLSEAVYGSQGTVESLSSKASTALDSVVSAASTKTEEASSVIIGTPPPASSVFSQASKVFGGAMAASLEDEPQIILDNEFVDDSTYSERVQSIIAAVGDKASDLTNAVSAAIIKPTATQGSVESAASIASEQYVRALSAASSALYGTTPGAVVSLSSAASDKYEQAVTAYVSPSITRISDPVPSPSVVGDEPGVEVEIVAEPKVIRSNDFGPPVVFVASKPPVFSRAKSSQRGIIPQVADLGKFAKPQW
jgi:hypothetical protein